MPRRPIVRQCAKNGATCKVGRLKAEASDVPIGSVLFALFAWSAIAFSTFSGRRRKMAEIRLAGFVFLYTIRVDWTVADTSSVSDPTREAIRTVHQTRREKTPLDQIVAKIIWLLPDRNREWRGVSRS